MALGHYASHYMPALKYRNEAPPRLVAEVPHPVVHNSAGLEINEKIQSQFCDKIRKLKRNFAKFRRKIVALHCVVSGVAKYEPTILVLKETAENGE